MESTEAFKGVLKKKLERLAKWTTENNVEGFVSEFTEDCVFMSPGNPTIHGRQELRELRRKAFVSQVVCEDVTVDEVISSGHDMFTCRGSVLLKAKDTKICRWIQLLKKVDGDWQIHWELWDTIPAPN